jgi:hypothetical protein
LESERRKTVVELGPGWAARIGRFDSVVERRKNGRLAYSTLPCRGTLKDDVRMSLELRVREKLQVGEVEVVWDTQMCSSLTCTVSGNAKKQIAWQVSMTLAEVNNNMTYVLDNDLHA